MPRLLRTLSLVVVFGLTGCASMNPKNWSIFNGRRARADAKTETTPPTEPAHASAPPTKAVNGVLAGRVIDSFNQTKPDVTIQVTPTEGGEPPTEIAANEEGYFMVQGLQTGRRYKLIARTKKGDQLLAGTTIAAPPNVQLVIRLSEDFARDGIPPPPEKGVPADKPGERKAAADAEQPRLSIDQSWSPNAAQRYLYEPDRGPVDRYDPGPGKPLDPKGAGLGAPLGPDGVIRKPASQPLPPVQPEYQTNDTRLTQNFPPAVALPSPIKVPSPSPFPKRELSAGRVEKPAAAATAASCVVRDQCLEEFVLSDLQGDPFRFSENRGQLVLLDFWGTWCPSCIQGMPILVDLQKRYGGRGLVVLGVAYEEGPLQERIDRVNFVRIRQSVNYKLLLGDGPDCPLRTKLGVDRFPTLILLDENGQIVWRGDGLSPQNRARLEAEIQKRLTAP